MSRKSNTKEFIAKATKKQGNRYDYSLVDYINAKTKVEIICSEHGIFPQTPNNHLNGKGCPDCYGNNKSDTEQFKEKSDIKHNFKYDYSLVNYINAKTKVEIICLIHGSFPQTPSDHLSGKGCPDCAGNQISNTEEFIEKAELKHNFKYDYSKVNYINNHTEIEIICPIHGSFPQIPSVHLFGCGCPDCGGTKKSNTEQFIEKSNIKHDFKYDYSLVDYINDSTEVEIICSIHGSFPQNPDSHLQGHGCQKCGVVRTALINTKSKEQFFADGHRVHNNKYDYSLVNYINNHTDVEIICPQHGSFPQTPNNHLQGTGCPRCSHIISKLEIQWLDSLNIPDDKEHRYVYIKIANKTFKVDGFDPITNTIYEFYGDFWHGNPKVYNNNPNNINKANKKTFVELYQKTLAKEQILKSAGYNIVSIWESEFKINYNATL